MALASGSRLGPYEIVAPLGAGGMGEVYKARDTRLDRTVAIKVLPGALAADPQFRERFDREARAISQLDHPHICALHDVGEQDGTSFLVMQYLGGETLEARLRKGALSLDQALQYAIQIADALATAHKAGIVHRDLKPGNVMLTKAGAKLLDFGLAKTGAPVIGGVGLSMLPTTPPITQQGTILGTVQYMAPEQLEGLEADARTDIFAFGAVVYEMVTGKMAFEGKSHASLISAIMTTDPPSIAASQPLTPPGLDRLVKQCMAKDPDDRWQTAHDLRSELRWIAGGGGRIGAGAVSGAPTSRMRERLAWAGVAVATATTVGLLILLIARPRPEPAAAIRFEVSPPAGTELLPGNANPNQALSPDGRHVAFVVRTASNQSVLAVRSFDRAEAQVLAGTDISVGEFALPFWSPDSRFIGFFAQGKLKKIDGNGGPSQVLCAAPAGEGGAWNRDGTIVFAPSGTSGLFRVSAAGGTPVPATTLDVSKKEQSHRWPSFLPDGRHFLYVATSPPTIYVGTLDSQERLRLLDSESKALYADGYLLFTRAGTLLAQPFDAAHLKITGEAFPVAEDVGVNTYNTRAAFSASSTGVLTYRTATTRQTQLVWFGRDGKQIEALGDQAEYEEPELSPDGKRVAVDLRDPATRDYAVWIYDVARGVRARLTFDPGSAIGPRWSPNGDSLVFSSNPEFSSNPSGHSKLIATPSSGAGTEQVLLEGNEAEYPDSWSPDGRFILYELNDPKTSWDLWVLPWAARKPKPVMQTNLRQEAGRFSPDGRWIAYRSTESGRSEVYVVPFPTAGGKWQISSAGGTYPRWRRDGREVFFLAPDNTLMAASVSGEGPAFEIGPVRSLFKTRLRNRGFLPYDVSADGQRFLVNAVPEPTAQVPMTVVVNWTAAIKK